MSSVKAEMNYSADNGRPIDYYFYAWNQVDTFSVDKQGFELNPISDEFDSYDDDLAIKKLFYPVIIDFVKQHTGAKRVAARGI